MDISVIKGSRKWSIAEWVQLSEPQAILFLTEGRCNTGRQELSGPLAFPFSPAEISELDLTNARAVLFPTHNVALQAVIPDNLSLRIVQETFFDQSRPATHQQAAIQLLTYQLANCALAPDHVELKNLAEQNLAYMKNNLSESISLDLLSKQFNCSKSALLAAFKRDGYRSPMKELSRLRIENACERLKENEQTITQSARSVGYETLSAFNHFFSRHTGRSPRGYRENCLWIT